MDLREMSPEQLKRGEERLMEKDVLVIDQGQSNFIDWWQVESNSHVYQVRRLFNFVWCECPSWFFTKECCHHISATYPAKCKCGRLIDVRGEMCDRCEMSSAMYYKPEKPAEKIGGFRV